jgi:hypothetical protein
VKRSYQVFETMPLRDGVRIPCFAEVRSLFQEAIEAVLREVGGEAGKVVVRELIDRDDHDEVGLFGGEGRRSEDEKEEEEEKAPGEGAHGGRFYRELKEEVRA